MSDLSGISVEQRFRLLVSAVTDYAIYMLDPDGLVATWNPGAERFKGYSAEEIIGQHFSRFFTPEDAASGLPEKALQTAAREGRFEAEGWRLRKDGTRFWVHAVIDPIRGDDGELIGFAKITRDVTERREREQALFESEQRFRLLVQGVRDYAIYMLDRDGIITNWNAGAQAIKGYTAAEVVGQSFGRFYTEEEQAAGEPAKALEAALREGKYEREAWRVRKDGTLFWANVCIDPIYDDSGQHIGFAKVTRDVTERKKAQEELESTREALVQSQKLQALGELTGGIAHDFNNLMTIIAGASDFLLKNPDLSPAKRKRYIEAIADTAERATSLTDHLLAFGRRQSIKPVVLDLGVRLDAFTEMIARMLGSQISVKLELNAENAMVEADPAQLETALLNAALNARDAMPSGGELTIAMTDTELDGRAAISIAIRDTGSGISAADMARVFEPFFTTKEVGKGTGLGLSQIHGFAAQAGGHADIRSTEGEGTTVRIILPRTGKKAKKASGKSRPVEVPEGIRILLVEDNDRVREFAAELLQDLRCEVETASDGAEALEMARCGGFDVILSDVVMPGMSGLELAERIAAEQPRLPVILATGFSQQLADQGDADFTVVAKPYDGSSLARAIAAVLDQKVAPSA